MKIKKNFWGACCLAVFLGLIAALFVCSEPGKAQLNQENTLVIGSQFGIGGSIDPRQGLGGPNLAPKLLIFEPLVYFDDEYTLKPLLLTSWDASMDARTWTLHLRKDVNFTDNTPLNTDALIFSIRYMTTPGSRLANIKTMKALDEHAVRITLKEPDGVFIHTISSLGIMGPGSVDQEGRFVRPVGTGPFIFKDYLKDREVVFEKNPDYWGKPPKVDKVIIKIIPNFNTRAMALESGEVDVADYLPAEILKKLDEDPRFTVPHKIPSPCPNWIGMNTRKEPFNDVRVRKAVNYAIDVKTIINTLINSIMPDLAVPALKGPHSQPLFSRIVNPDLGWYGYDVSRAKALLEEAGWKDTDGDGILDKDGKPFKVELISSLLYAEGTEISETIQSQLQKVGMDVSVKVLESGARFQAYREKRYDLIELGGICPHNDPSPWYEYYFHSRKHPAYSIMDNEEINAEIDALSQIIDKEERMRSFHRLQFLLETNAPGIFLYIQNGALAHGKGIKDFHMNCGMTGAYSYAWKVSKQR